MKNRAVMGMDGNGGQTILIDFERGRIVATLSVFDGMRFPRQGSFDYKRISYDVIKNGSPLSNEHQKGSATITSDEIRSANVARRTQHESAKQNMADAKQSHNHSKITPLYVNVDAWSVRMIASTLIKQT